MPVLYTNNATSTLAAGIAAGATSITVQTGHGARFPSVSGSDYFYATLTNSAGTTNEVVRVTARATDALTVVRGQDGTTAAAWNAGDRIELRMTKAMLDDFKADARSGLMVTGLNSVAILGNSVAAGAVPPSHKTASVQWQPSTSVALNAIVEPSYADMRNGLAPIRWVCTTAGVTGSGLEPAWNLTASPGATVADGTVVWTAQNLNGAGSYRWNWGFWHVAQALSGQRLNEAVVVSRSGRQSNDILSYVPRIQAMPDVSIVAFFSLFENDTWPGSAPTLATITSRWNAFVVAADGLRAAGKRVMVATLLPSGNIDAASGFTGYTFGNGSRAWLWLNDKIREYAALRSDVILWDAANVYLDTNIANPIWPENTVTYLSEVGSGPELKKTDGIHPNWAGHWLLGRSLADVLAQNFPPRPFHLDHLDPYNDTINPRNFGTAGGLGSGVTGANVPNLITVQAYGTNVTGTVSKVARTDTPGDWLRVAYNATGGTADNASVDWTSTKTPNIPAGSVIQAFSEVRVLANPTLLKSLEIMLNLPGTTNQWVYATGWPGNFQDMGQMFTSEVTLTLKTPPVVMPTGTTGLILYRKAHARGAANFTVDFGRSGVMRVTQIASA
jgi:hypothetical protein